ncbi:MAG TPA: cation transporter [Rhodospirillaceae bacterium]|nr:cation transporter [Rhodospirillaceae bacterium]
MSACCGGQCGSQNVEADGRLRRILRIALLINAAMFIVEVISGLVAGSAALQADALDFLGDATNFGISLSVLRSQPRTRAKAALIKGATMAAFGSWVVASTAWHAWFGTLPLAEVMGAVGLVALLANGTIALLLYAYREGDANLRSVWICARNDSIANIAVMLAASGVLATGTHWPDIAVAAVIATLNLTGAAQVIGRARSELRLAAAE